MKKNKPKPTGLAPDGYTEKDKKASIGQPAPLLPPDYDGCYLIDRIETDTVQYTYRVKAPTLLEALKIVSEGGGVVCSCDTIDNNPHDVPTYWHIPTRTKYVYDEETETVSEAPSNP